MLTIPSDSRNLAYRAARAFLDSVELCANIHITLKKTIPVGAGLGGGSSNAAAVLLALYRLFHASISKDTLYRLAAQLGADVPFFLTGGCMYGTGIGDKLEELPPVLTNEYVVVVAPPIHISTAWAYAKLKIPLTNIQKNTNLKHFFLRGDVHAQWRRSLVNDFEGAIFNAFPVLKAIKKKLYDLGAIYASLTGTGSAVFGVFAHKDLAANGVTYFQVHYPAFLSRPVRFGLHEIDAQEREEGWMVR